MAYFMMR